MQQECIPTSLLKLTTESSGRAIKMFSAVQRYMGDAGELPAGAAKLDLVNKLLSQVCPFVSLCYTQQAMGEGHCGRGTPVTQPVGH